MNLYRWYSEFLSDCRLGYIIVMATSVEEAKRLAVEEFDKEYYGWLNDNDEYKQDEDYIESYKEKFSEFELDLNKEPEIVSKCLLIKGSM